jgi:hypothetical protein
METQSIYPNMPFPLQYDPFGIMSFGPSIVYFSTVLARGCSSHHFSSSSGLLTKSVWLAGYSWIRLTESQAIHIAMISPSSILDQLVHFRDSGDLAGLGLRFGGIFTLTYAAFKYIESKRSPVCPLPASSLILSLKILRRDSLTPYLPSVTLESSHPILPR